jgi:hypothetical protein
LLVGQEGWDVNRWYHRANSCLVIPKTGIMKINPESVAHFWRLKSDRRLTSFHQHSTTNSPPKNHVLRLAFAKTPAKTPKSPHKKT